MKDLDIYAVLKKGDDNRLEVVEGGYGSAREVKAAATRKAKENPDVAFFPVRMWSPVAYQEIKKYEAVSVDFDIPMKDVEEDGGDADAGADAGDQTQPTPKTDVEKTEVKADADADAEKEEVKVETPDAIDDGSDSTNFNDLFSGEETTPSGDTPGELF